MEKRQTPARWKGDKHVRWTPFRHDKMKMHLGTKQPPYLRHKNMMYHYMICRSFGHLFAMTIWKCAFAQNSHHTYLIKIWYTIIWYIETLFYICTQVVNSQNSVDVFEIGLPLSLCPWFQNAEVLFSRWTKNYIFFTWEHIITVLHKQVWLLLLLHSCKLAQLLGFFFYFWCFFFEVKGKSTFVSPFLVGQCFHNLLSGEMMCAYVSFRYCFFLHLFLPFAS